MKQTSIVLLACGGIAAIWGYSYMSSHKLEQMGAVFGFTSATYKVAAIIAPLGLVAALVGLVLLVITLSKSTRSNKV